MAINKKTINLIDLDFDSAKQSLQEFLKADPTFADYDFEGSGLSVLLDALTYRSVNNAFLANMLANEMFMDTALLRSSVVSHAKFMGYTPKSKTAAKAKITVSVPVSSSTAESVLMPRGTRFTSSANGEQFRFTTLQDYNLYRDGVVFVNDDVEIYEGRIASYSWTYADGLRLVIPSTSIDTKTVRVAVYESDNSSSFLPYVEAKSLIDVKGDSYVYWINEIDGQYELRFGDDVFGVALKPGNLVYVEYIESAGVEGNGIRGFSLSGQFEGYDAGAVSITTNVPSAGGAEQEGLNSIRFMAQRSFSAQNRAVTAEDYATIVRENYPYARSVVSWGGEQNIPPQYGKVFISIVPQDGTKLSDSNKQLIINNVLKGRTVTGILPEIVDPVYIRLSLAIKIIYDQQILQSPSALSSIAKGMTLEYVNEKLGLFGEDFYNSDLVCQLQDLGDGIISVNVDPSLSLLVTPTITSSVYDFSFDNQIVEGSFRTSVFRFVGDDNDYIAKDKNGNIVLYVVDDQGNTTETSTSVGTIDYASGRFVTNDLQVESYEGAGVTVFVAPVERNVYSPFNKVLLCDTNSISVSIEAK